MDLTGTVENFYFPRPRPEQLKRPQTRPDRGKFSTELLISEYMYQN